LGHWRERNYIYIEYSTGGDSQIFQFSAKTIPTKRILYKNNIHTKRILYKNNILSVVGTKQGKFARSATQLR
jgi:hypothetical protein